METRDLPTGTVTFLFTDVEGSTRLLQGLGAETYAEALATHRRLVRAACTAHGGAEVDTQGDAFFVAFRTAPEAIAAAREASAALEVGPIRVRMGLHTGSPLLTDEGYVGPDVHKGARITAVGHGGQILVSAATAALLPHAELRDLGIHRLKDLTTPERIFQVDTGEYPALTSLHRAVLPLSATPFLGRVRELDELADLLARPEARLVTLTGPGGIGKTRLALQAAERQRYAYRDGVVFVDLAAVRESDFISAAIVAAMLLRPNAGEEATAAVTAGLREKDILLILDNLEQLLPAAARIVAALLDSAPGLRLLVTSRAPLRLRAEREFPVPSLDWRASDHASDGPPPAVSLFIERARAIGVEIGTDEKVPVIASICERLDGLPLAIELAAARLRVFGLDDLRRRLAHRLTVLGEGERDRPERQQTLRATIGWSEELLEPSQRRLLATLSVFAGPFTLDAAEAIADDAARESVVDGIGALLEHSMLRVVDSDASPRRYAMLETVREFASDRLESGADADAVRRRHARHFTDLVRVHGPRLRTLEIVASRAVLEPSYADCRAALDLLLADSEDPAPVIDLFTALVDVWAEFHRWSEGAAYATEVVTRIEGGGSLEIATAFHFAGTMAWLVGDYDVARGRWVRGLELYRRLGDKAGMARSLNNLAMVTSDLHEALALFRESYELQSAAGDLADASVLVNIAAVAIALEDFDEARRAAAQAHDLASRVGDVSRIAASLRMLGWLSFVTGDLETSEARSREGLSLAKASSMRADESASLAQLGWIAVRRDQPQGEVLLGNALALADSQEWASFVLLVIIPAALEIALRRDDTANASRLRNALLGVLERQPLEIRGAWLRKVAGIPTSATPTSGSMADRDAAAAVWEALHAS